MTKNKGIIPINKPQGWTSFDVVNKLKYRVKPLKVGHLGTLDPMATGVLLVTVGKATKLFDLMQEKTKTYVAAFEFGYETDTLDATGETIKKCENIPTKDEIMSILPKFIGKISQIPPKYSAKSVDGQRAYDLARKNIEFELKPKVVDIHDIKLISYKNNVLKLEIECGSGTYIRAIGRDLAESLNTLATMTSLVRTKIDNFNLDKCYDVQDIENIEEKIIPIKDILNYPIFNLSKIEEEKILNGQKLNIELDDGIYRL
ncbi:MAG: tRNA pseudouridine(55) synthase TruB, partial [Clostridia bacterium]|nr:tRNA pseudouridine(55) synthase TruB [Clostridia bacterium]